MKYLLSCAAVAALAMSATTAAAATYTFSFGNDNGSVNGDVVGLIELGDGDGTFAATSVTVTSAPTSLGYTLALDFLDPANGYTRDFGNTFTVSGGEIVSAAFGRLNATEGLLLGDTSFGSFLNIVGSANQNAGVADADSSSLQFAVAAVPLPASLPLLMAGIGGIGMVRRRKRQAA